jgi:hypothetical protein
MSDFFPTLLAENPICRISSRRCWQKIRRVGFLPDAIGRKSGVPDFFLSMSGKRVVFCPAILCTVFVTKMIILESCNKIPHNAPVFFL